MSYSVVKNNRFSPYKLREVDSLIWGPNFLNDWWFQPACKISFSYFDIDDLYPEDYFIVNPDGSGHPTREISHDLYQYMQKVYTDIVKKPFSSVMELGSGGGEITYEFLTADLDFCTVEGTIMGHKKLLDLGVPPERAIRCDLRLFNGINRKFDLAMCTEVAEHLEPFFASKIVEQCVKHSDYVWFSAADRNRRPSTQHPNEHDIEVWDKLFAFFGYTTGVVLDGRYGRASRLYIKDRA